MFKCDKCDCVYSLKGHLTRHIKTFHDKIKNIKCDKCEYICSNNSDLNKHIKCIHDKIKDFKCSKCEFICSTNGHLIRHVKTVHDKIKNIKCDKCEYVCPDNSYLKQHIKQIHDKIKDVKCDKCDYTCSNKGLLTQHIKRIHDKIKDFKCDKCEYVCSTNGHLIRHIKGVHERPIMDKRMTLGEYVIYEYLTKNKIEFEREMKFKGLVSQKNKQLRYDFYIKSHNLLIEFDGRQHFEKIKWTITETENDVNEHYNYIVECDHLKNEYADANKIKLYRIKYTEIKNIDNILKVLLI